MASAFVNMPLSVGTIKGVDCLNYGNHKPNALLISSSVSILPCRPMFAIKASTSDGPALPLPPKPSTPARYPLPPKPLQPAIYPLPPKPLPPARYPLPPKPSPSGRYPLPPKPSSPPARTLMVPSLGRPRPNRIVRRPRPNRESPTSLSPASFVYPLFIHEGEEDIPIGAMPGCYRLGWRHGLLEEVSKARDVGINRIMLLPKVSNALKTPTGDEAYNDSGLVPRTIRLLNYKFPDLIIYTDVSLDPYFSDAHEGIVKEDGVIMNDKIVYQLCKQAVSQARAGADIVSPRAMMDGCVGAIRSALDAEGFRHVFIMSYTAKFASSFDDPFREALDSNPCFGDKKIYQMNPGDRREALIKLHVDESEGANILLVRPGLPYLDVIKLLHDNSNLPIAAYQVSGEYSMIKAGGFLNMIDEKNVMMESLMCLRGAGADIILTYFALEAARCLCGVKLDDVN